MIPLPLAEMLYATLGPLAETLAAENHPWAALAERVLEAYKTGRNDQLVAMYGQGVIPEISKVTQQVADAVCGVVAEMADEEMDFAMWAGEFDARAE
ncbi:hypothetical protein BST11_25495 [Mycobacterium alsense]|nr:hypothetical protein BST11_25495 [Mycobacterium alsense]